MDRSKTDSGFEHRQCVLETGCLRLHRRRISYRHMSSLHRLIQHPCHCSGCPRDNQKLCSMNNTCCLLNGPDGVDNLQGKPLPSSPESWALSPGSQSRSSSGKSVSDARIGIISS